MTSRSLPKLMRSVEVRSAMENSRLLMEAKNQCAAPDDSGGCTNMRTISEKAKDRPRPGAACPGRTLTDRLFISKYLAESLQLDLGARGLELFLNLLGLGLADALLDRLGSALDEVLGL